MAKGGDFNHLNFLNGGWINHWDIIYISFNLSCQEKKDNLWLSENDLNPFHYIEKDKMTKT